MGKKSHFKIINTPQTRQTLVTKSELGNEPNRKCILPEDRRPMQTGPVSKKRHDQTTTMSTRSLKYKRTTQVQHSERTEETGTHHLTISPLTSERRDKWKFLTRTASLNSMTTPGAFSLYLCLRKRREKKSRGRLLYAKSGCRQRSRCDGAVACAR